MHENPYEKMNTFSLGDSKNSINPGTEIAIGRLNRTTPLERRIIKDYKKISLLCDEGNLDIEKSAINPEQLLSNLGKLFKEAINKMFVEIELASKTSLAKARVGSFLQILLIKISLENVNLDKFRDPAFVNSFIGEDNLMLIRNFDDWNAVLRGAENAFEYLRMVQEEKDVIFIGIDVHFDSEHGIDFMLARTNNDSESISPAVDTIELIEVKSGLTRPDEIEHIHSRHKTFVRNQKKIVLNGFNTDESKGYQRKMFEEHKKEEKVKQYLEERLHFIKNILTYIESGRKTETWEDVVDLGRILTIDPIKVHMRINNIPQIIFNLFDDETKVKLIEFRKMMADIVIPTDVLGLSRRLYNKNTSMSYIQSATLWKSTVAFKIFDGPDGWRKDEILIDEI